MIRCTGIAIEREESAVGGCCVASPILLGGRPIAALSVSVPAESFKPELLAPAVRTAALALGRILACSDRVWKTVIDPLARPLHHSAGAPRGGGGGGPLRSHLAGNGVVTVLWYWMNAATATGAPMR
uniref:IclR family transcriptional regulator domain-containing protein n=1 Tax=Nocardia abscessus TaxID=120957 RepID=UPI002454F244